MDPMQAERIQTDAAFHQLREEWNALLRESSSDSVFLTWEWLYTWWRHLAGGRRLAIVTLRDGGELIAIAPLCLRPPRPVRLLPFRSLEFLGTGFVGSDYLDFIIRRGREEVALEAIERFLRAERYMLELSQVRRGGSHASRVAARLAGNGWTLSATATNVCPYVSLAGHTITSYLATLSSQHRYNYQRRKKNLAKTFAVRFEAAAVESEREQALDVLLHLHDLRWQQRGEASDAFHLPALVSFHREFTRLALERGWLRLFVLWLDDQPAAALYGFRYGSIFSFYQSGFDPAFSRYSVGLVMMGMAIEKAIEEGAAEYDMLHGSEEYKFHWAREVRELERLQLFPPRFRGLAARKSIEFSRVAGRMARQVLPKTFVNRLSLRLGLGTS